MRLFGGGGTSMIYVRFDAKVPLGIAPEGWTKRLEREVGVLTRFVTLHSWKNATKPRHEFFDVRFLVEK